MRNYHIYIQRTKIVERHCYYAKHKWMPWEYLGYVNGTKELYICFKRKYNKKFYDKFNYFEDEYMYESFDIFPHEYHRYLIIDEKGVVRDFYELTGRYKKKKIYYYGNGCAGWNEHWMRLASDQRKSVTPEEIRDIKDEYGISLKSIKPKRNMWDYKCNKISGWKMQSKRRKQWKEKQ